MDFRRIAQQYREGVLYVQTLETLTIEEAVGAVSVVIAVHRQPNEVAWAFLERVERERAVAKYRAEQLGAVHVKRQEFPRFDA